VAVKSAVVIVSRPGVCGCELEVGFNFFLDKLPLEPALCPLPVYHILRKSHCGQR